MKQEIYIMFEIYYNKISKYISLISIDEIEIKIYKHSNRRLIKYMYINIFIYI